MIVEERTAPYRAFSSGKYRMTMGLLPLLPEQWIEIDEYFEPQLRLKSKLLETRHSDVFNVLPDAERGAHELLALLARHLPVYHPTIFALSGDCLMNKVTEEIWNVKTPSLHPLEIAGRLVQEDFCVLTNADNNYHLTGGVLCFPANWRLSQKIGRSITEIHEPVPEYAEKLAGPVNRVLAMLKPDKIVWRCNWLILDDPSLFQQDRLPMASHVTASNAGEMLWLRAERQTLRRLSESDAIIFTIRTHVTPLWRAVSTKDDARTLRDVIREMPGGTLNYRQMMLIRDDLVQWLETRYDKLPV